MTNSLAEKAVREYKTCKRRRIKSQILELKKNNEDLFKMWCYEKCHDEVFLKKSARQNLIELEKLEMRYERVSSEEPNPREIDDFMRSERMSK